MDEHGYLRVVGRLKVRVQGNIECIRDYLDLFVNKPICLWQLFHFFIHLFFALVSQSLNLSFT